ncbi:MAG: ABC transporter ATP-binding protein [Chlorobiaceae bacterium]|nr:ABC transporter ATP-binding protein [Chlorobiaceae bacterium]NTW75261.1 ABC transporter ATP-binding protein [Chlorobiaceae bacterium]
MKGGGGGFRTQQDETLSGRQRGSVDLYIVKRLFGYIKPFKGLITGAVLLTAGGAMLGPLRPWLTKVAIDEYIARGDHRGLAVISLIMLGVVILDGLKQYQSTWLTELIGQKAVFNLRMDIFRHLQRLPVRYFDRNPVGRIITRTTNDVEALDEMLSSGLITVIGDLLQLVFIVAMMLWIDWRLTLVVLSVLPLMIWSTISFKNRVRQAMFDVRTHLARLNSFFQEHITGMKIVQLFGREESEFQRHAGINADHRDANIRTVFYFSIYYPLIEFMSSTAAGLVIWYSATRVVNAELTVGVVVSFVQYIWLFFRPLQHLSDRFNVMQTAVTSSDRIFRLLEEPVAPEPTENAAAELRKFSDRIVFDNVSFAYDGDNLVLRDISFEIRAGQTVAIVGATGSGKTTLINILSRFYPIHKGSITIDGSRLDDIPSQALRRLIGVVMQDVVLFSGTIRENLCFGDPTIPEESVREAARIVGADRFIEKLPGGYDYRIRENGSGLSVGQKQLIAFVRALLYNPEILVLDEATSSVDTETESLIEQATDQLMKQRTSIIIAHRLSTVQHADRIIVLHKGTIRETGTHQELLARRGLYYKLYLLQHPERRTLEDAG